MMIVYFFNGLAFGGLGLAAYLQLRRGSDLPLSKQLPWLAAFGFSCGATSWIDMFLVSGSTEGYIHVLEILRLVIQPLTGVLLLKFGWGILTDLTPLPAWTIFIPGVLIVPIAYGITYASTTFITPSPIGIPIDIWSRYLLYLPGSIMAGIGFLRQWSEQRKLGFSDVSGLMLGAGLAFIFEAFVVGLVVPAAPYSPASYYNYDRVAYNAFTGEQTNPILTYGLTAWLDYERVLETTGFPIQFWRMISALAVTFFVVKGLDVFDAIRKRHIKALQEERDRAQREAFEAQIAALETAESWTDALVSINRQITELENVDNILLYIIKNAKRLLRSDFIGLALSNEDHSQLLLKCHSHDDKVEMIRAPLLVENPLILQALQTNQSYRSPIDGPPGMLDSVCPILDKPALAIAIVPIDLDNRPIGALWIARCKGEDVHYSGTDLIWLECMADQVVIAIQHGLMTSQLQSLSISEERARIARDMHDGLAQVLGYLNLQVQTLEALYRQGKEESFQTELKHMRQAVQSAHADVRENILSLRTTLANERGLASAISEYLDEFGIQTGIETQFIDELGGDLDISSVAEVQLVCILQEALANVRKHAQAKRVNILITKDDDHIYMKVSDNGVGFVERNSKRSFGLQTMRERASSVKGTLMVHSSQGKGTSVACRLPCLQHEKMSNLSVSLSEKMEFE
jgi:signal transduction histidine kinase